MDFQYYPTPSALVSKAWSKFVVTPIIKVLEPSAGEGHLVNRFSSVSARYGENAVSVDVVELDITKHPLLKSKGFNVVGVDFMQFQGAALYSHIIMNPPFAYGVDHVLKAWDILFDGELVAIINAETIKNPFSKERKLLVSVIEQYGSVEYVQDAFLADDAERSTAVEVAIVYLRKTGDFGGVDLLASLAKDKTSTDALVFEFEDIKALAIPENEIENSVRLFNAAVLTMKDSAFAAHRSARYASMLGVTLARWGDRNDFSKTSDVRKAIDAGYVDLKDRAWTRILRSTEVSNRLSAKGQKVLEAQFEDVKKLEFTTSNIYSFLIGLINSQSDINLEMALDVFDSVTRYHSENAVYYKGWKSNDKHIAAARRIKTTRFIIPNHHRGYGANADWATVRFLGDYDKVFAMLDGKDITRKDDDNPFVGLADLFDNNESYRRLCAGERLSASYFDIRYYPSAGTIHFFPRNKVLIDRLNRLVGRHRQWLPQDNERVSDAFWLQYDLAEKYAKDVEKALGSNDRLHFEMSDGRDEFSRAKSISKVNAVLDDVLAKHGIDPVLAIARNGNHDAFGLPLMAA
jgi:hypothetical protein